MLIGLEDSFFFQNLMVKLEECLEDQILWVLILFASFVSRKKDASPTCGFGSKHS